MAAKKKTSSAKSANSKLSDNTAAERTGGTQPAEAKASTKTPENLPAAVTTTPGKSAQAPSDGRVSRIPTNSGSTMETPTEAPQKGGLTGSPSWTPPAGPDVAANPPGIPMSGTPAATPRGTPKASSPSNEPWSKGSQGPVSPASDEPTQDLTALREAASSHPAAGPEVVLTFDRGSNEARARADREKAVLRPGTSLRIRYVRDAEDLGQATGKPVRIELGYRFDALPVGMATIADGQRTREGGLVRREPTLKVPTEARGELQLWFRVDLDDGRTLWDSLYGHNHRFKVTG